MGSGTEKWKFRDNIQIHSIELTKAPSQWDCEILSQPFPNLWDYSCPTTQQKCTLLSDVNAIDASSEILTEQALSAFEETTSTCRLEMEPL